MAMYESQDMEQWQHTELRHYWPWEDIKNLMADGRLFRRRYEATRVAPSDVHEGKTRCTSRDFIGQARLAWSRCSGRARHGESDGVLL
jgi:hypothetical protein